MPRVKEVTISFRIDKITRDFVDDFAQQHGLQRSDMIRRILEYFYTAYLMGEFRTPIKVLKEQLAARIGVMEERERKGMLNPEAAY